MEVSRPQYLWSTCPLSLPFAKLLSFSVRLAVDSRMAGFSKEQRLLAKPQFDAVLNNGIKTVCKDFVLIASKMPREDQTSRLGLIVSRKVGGSVERNRIKRCVRESFRSGSVLAGRDLVVIARPSLTSADGQVKRDVRQSFEKCLERMTKSLVSVHA